MTYSIIGYSMGGNRTVVMSTDAETFEIVHATSDSAAYRGDIKRVQGQAGEFGMIDFTELRTDGEYQIRFGNTKTETFHIDQSIPVPSLWRLINFLYYGRHGYPVLNCHDTCYRGVCTDHDRVRIIFNGGWHDMADASQQTMQSTEVPGTMMTSVKEARKFDKMPYLRMMEETNWGLDFILRMRLGDGYRTSHAALGRWTDGLMGNVGDAIVGVNNRSFENLMFAAVEAGTTGAFGGKGPELVWKCLGVAKENFIFADERFREVGLEEPHMVEHTIGVSLSQYYSATTWAVARLYKMTKEDRFAVFAKEHAGKVMVCQETSDETLMNGYLYRNETKKHVIHPSYQTRDYVSIMVLAEVREVLKSHEKIEIQGQAAKLRGEYLKELKVHTQPYGILPVNIHYISEINDEATFDVFHLITKHEAERANYREQLGDGIGLGDGYYTRRFPVWFSYRGNSIIRLSMGRMASILGQHSGDRELTEIGHEQLYWTLGEDPFARSLMYSKDDGYGQEHTALLGETVGGMPVGVQARRNEDLPY